ncbi:MAG: ribonuclease III [Cyclobacteriaceae bacterium]|nr:ribonuclease III [Cyclobacteriaceae bacterium]
MHKAFRRALNLFQPFSLEDKKLRSVVQSITGKKPINLKLYKLSIKHSSVSEPDVFGKKESYERLEYLGDAYLGAVVAEYLYKKYPYKDEGFLTDIRSRLVNRESLNQLAKKLGLEELISFEKKNGLKMHRSIYGDVMEALVGAVYLDYGFRTCRHFILHKLIEPNFNIDKIVNENPNYKSQIIEWSQKNGKEISFETENVETKGNFKEFEVSLFIEGKFVVNGHGPNKKKAEQSAARKALEIIAPE